MTRPSTRYSSALHTPGHSLLATPTTRQLDNQSFISTITISPIPSFRGRESLFSNHTVAANSPDHDQSLLGSEMGSSEDDQIQRLRLWRHDALVQHQYETAAFIGDKILAKTNDPNDAFWLAQVYYNSGHYARARHLLQQQELLSASVACRCLAAQCLIALQKWTDALELLGEENPFKALHKHGRNVKNADGGIRLEASMCHLRGLCFSNLNQFDRAKVAYQEALTIDVKCYDALDQLLQNSLMTAEEEWTFLDSLTFRTLHAEDIEIIKMMYTIRLNKYRAGDAFAKAETILTTKFGFANNTDILLAKAEQLFAQCKFLECNKVTQRILDLDRYKFSALSLHLTCLHELGKKNDVFLLSHDMADRHPEEPVTWLAVGIYYMTIHKIAEARRYFSKASVMNPRLGAAWIGFAHSFAMEGEHDQAISAYTTAARLFQGTHLPSLFLGMQHLHLNNVVLADEYLNTAYRMCEHDPLLLNELGVVCFHKQRHEEAIQWFERALEMAVLTGSNSAAWVATHANLGHANRKLKRYDIALEHFAEVKRLSPLDGSAYAASGLIELHLGRIDQAVTSFHHALSLTPSDVLSTDLLSTALAEAAENCTITWPPEAEVDRGIDALLQSASNDMESDMEDMDRSD